MIVKSFTAEYPEGRYIEIPDSYDEEETEEVQSDG